MHQCSIGSRNKRFSKKKIAPIIFVHAVHCIWRHAVYVDVRYNLKQHRVIAWKKILRFASVTLILHIILRCAYMLNQCKSSR